MRWEEENYKPHQLIEQVTGYRFHGKILVDHLEQFRIKYPLVKPCQYYYQRLHRLINNPVTGVRNLLTFHRNKLNLILFQLCQLHQVFRYRLHLQPLEYHDI